MKNYKTEGIVLKRINFGEADKLITILTKHYGKLRLIAKGVRKTTSKKAPFLEPFQLNYLSLTSGRNIDLITEVENIKNFNGIRKNLKKIALGYKICELIDRLCPEKQRNQSLYFLVVDELEKLSGIEVNDYHVNDFIHKMLWDLGYLPEEKVISCDEIEQFIENLAERKFKSSQLLTKVDGLLL